MGIGGILSPILGAMTYAIGGFMSAFMVLGIGYLCMTPFIFWKLNQAYKQWDLERQPIENPNLQANQEDDEDQNLLSSGNP